MSKHQLQLRKCSIIGVILTLDAANGLRAGDALHLAAALDIKAKSIATLNEVLAKNAKRMKLKQTKI